MTWCTSLVLALVASCGAGLSRALRLEAIGRQAGLEGGAEGQPGACSDDLGCSLNGECRAGRCACDAAWSGNADCSALALLPARRRGGYGHINSTTSSWGAGVVYDPVSKKFIMVAEEMDLGCGLQTWAANSRCIVATSDTVDGEYRFHSVAVDAFAHSCTQARDPVSGAWIVSHTGDGNGHDAPVCTDRCASGITLVEKEERRVVPCSGRDHPFKHPIAASSPYGPWQKSEKLMGGLIGGMEPWFLPNGTLFAISNSGPGVGWLDKEGRKASNRPTIARAESLEAATHGEWSWLPWRAVLAGSGKAFSDDECAWPQIWWEDHHIFADRRGNFHILAHAWSGRNTTYPAPGCKTKPFSLACQALIGHAFSRNAVDWYISPVAAATGETTFEDGETVHWRARERPHVVQDQHGELLAVVTGVGDPHCDGANTGVTGCDHTFTLVQRVKREPYTL